jgi:hypothetical protein
MNIKTDTKQIFAESLQKILEKKTIEKNQNTGYNRLLRRIKNNILSSF